MIVVNCRCKRVLCGVERTLNDNMLETNVERDPFAGKNPRQEMKMVQMHRLTRSKY